MNNNNTQLCLIVGAIILLAVVVYFCMQNKSNFIKGSQKNDEKNAVENFTALAAGANDNTGMLLDDSYELLQGADNNIPASNFADMVNQGDHMKEYIEQPKSLGEHIRPTERLHRIQGKALMPNTSKYVTPFNVDVANPTSHKYMVNTPRVSSALRSRYLSTDLSTMIRGDIPITYYANVPLVSKSSIGREALNLAGLFTPYNVALYNKYTGKAHKNLVQKVAGAGQASGYGGASGETLLDAY